MAIIFRLQPLSFGFLRVSDSWRAPLLWFYLSKVSHFLLPVSFVGTAAQARLKPFPCPGKWPRFICPDATWNQSNCGISIKWYILTSWINKFWLFFGLHQLRGWVWFLHYRPGLFNLNFIGGIFSFGWLVFRGGISANPRITISYFVCICVFLFAGMYSQVLKLYVLCIYENFWLWALEQKKTRESGVQLSVRFFLSPGIFLPSIPFVFAVKMAGIDINSVVLFTADKLFYSQAVTCI